MVVKSCPKNNEFYSHLAQMLLEMRPRYHIAISDLCSDSGVSTRTFSKIKKRYPVKPECYIRLLIGICKYVTQEEFMEIKKKNE